MAPSRRRLLWALLCASVMPVAVACSDLIGLSEYERAECSGGRACTEAGVNETGPRPDTGADARPDVQGVDASGTKPVQWPQFRMPNYLQDGGPGDNIPVYGPTDGGIADSITNLVWQQPIVPGGKTYTEAQDICAKLTAGGKWRLPSRIELVTLLNLAPPSGTVMIDPNAFSNTQAQEYWTSSEVRPDQGERKHWTVDFKNGGLSQASIGPSGSAGVRCIKDAP